MATGTGLLLQPSFYLSMIERQDQADPMLINLSGACHFIVGLIVVVNSFGTWSVDSVAVSLLGAAATLKGVFLIILPHKTADVKKMREVELRRSGIAFVGAGLFFLGVVLF